MSLRMHILMISFAVVIAQFHAGCRTRRRVDAIPVPYSTDVATTAPGNTNLIFAFPPRPRLIYTAQEIRDWKRDPSRALEISNLVVKANRLLEKGLVIPEQAGDWIFYYACPHDNSDLDAETPERHVCPSCKRVYTDARTQAAYRTKLSYQADAQLVQLAQAYAVSGDERYAVAVRDGLLKLARLYPTFTRHDRWGRRGFLAVVGGRRYAQHLDEAVQVIKLAGAYDLVAAAVCFNADERRTIEDGLLGFIAREILRLQGFAGGQNNHQTWFNAAYATVGVAIGDAGLVGESLNGAAGLRWQLQKSVTDDGLWFEGTLAYQSYAMQAIMRHLEALRRVGILLMDDARLKSLWLGPINLAYPDGSLPVFHDSDPMRIDQFKGTWAWGYEYFHDNLLGVQAGKLAGSKITPVSADLRGIGLAVLRAGAGDDAACAMLDYGQHGGHHGHPDKLGIVLYALGRELLVDPGRISYSVPEYQTWCRTTVAHNTVVIDGDDQAETTGILRYFTNTAHYAAAICHTDKAYRGYGLTRALVVTDRLLVDAFAVAGKRAADIDLVMHVRGMMATNGMALDSETARMGRKNGYQHLAQSWHLPGQPERSLRFNLGGGKILTVWMPDTNQVRLHGGAGIGYRLGDKVPFILRRASGVARHFFVTVYDLNGQGDGITGVTRRGFEDMQTGEIMIEGPAGQVRIRLDLRPEAAQPVLVEDRRTAK